MIHIKTDDELQQYKNKVPDQLVVVQFSAKWCTPCKKYAPQLEALAKDTPNAVFVYVDVDELEDSPDCKKIVAIPSFHYYKGGKMVAFLQGLNMAQVKEYVNKFI